MANTINTAILIDDPKRLVLQVNITGDGSGDEAGTTLVDPATQATSANFPGAALATEYRIDAAQWALTSFSAVLLWDATTDIQALTLPTGWGKHHAWWYGGLRNNSGAGKTGKILITTTGLVATGRGTLVLNLAKKFT